MRASQADKGLRTISGTQMSYNQKVPVFSGTFLLYRPIFPKNVIEYKKEVSFFRIRVRDSYP